MTKRLGYLLNNSGVDYVLESYRGKEFDEYICSCGGDVVRYRVYGDSEENYKIYVK